MEDYREHVRGYYADDFEDDPDAFPFMRPTRICIVASLARVWVFAAANEEGEDEQIIETRWEDERLATLEILHSPKHEQEVRAVGVVGDEYKLIDASPLTAYIGPDNPHSDNPENPFRFIVRSPGVGMPGWDLAELHASNLQLKNAIDALQNRQIDKRALRQLRQELAELDRLTKRQHRGHKFQDFMLRLLAAHGCKAEIGKHRPGEQLDVFVHRPFRALVECRWTKPNKPVGATDVANLIIKLMRGRPIVAGIYVSMSGFTSEAPIEARTYSHDRVVVLFERHDVETLLSGEAHVADLFEKRVDEMVRRY